MRPPSTVAALMLTLAASTGHAASGVSAFGPGEQSTYAVSYLGVVVGEAQVTVGLDMRQYEQDVWPILCTARTMPEWTVFPVNDRYISYWAPAAGHNVGSDFFVEENKKRRRERVRLAHTESKAFVTRAWEGEAMRPYTYELDQATVDVAGATLALRNIPLVVGATHQRPVFTGQVSFTMKAVVDSKLTIDTPLGRREVFKVKVSSQFSGQLATRRDLHIYFTADAYQVPVRFEADMLLGQVTAELVRYEPGRDLTKG